MKILAIDTTTFLGSVAIVEDDRLVGGIQQGTQVTYSERLLHSIDHLLEGARWQREEIDLVAASIGPGSFTGLRIGLGTAKGLAAALAKPMVGVSSLEVLAAGAQLHEGVVVPVIDARRDEVYAAFYTATGGKLRGMETAEFVCPPAVLCEKVSTLAHPFVMVGDGVRRYRELFETRMGARAIIPDDALHFPHASYVAHLGKQKFEHDGEDELATLVPNYVRQSDAEIGFTGRHQQKR